MECSENAVESQERFENDLNQCIEKEKVSDIVEMKNCEYDAKGFESDTPQKTSHQSPLDESSIEPEQNLFGTKEEINGNLSPSSLFKSEEAESVLEPSVNALFETGLETNAGHGMYSDISSCSDSEPTLECDASSSIEPDICARMVVDQNSSSTIDFSSEVCKSSTKDTTELHPTKNAEPDKKTIAAEPKDNSVSDHITETLPKESQQLHDQIFQCVDDFKWVSPLSNDEQVKESNGHSSDSKNYKLSLSSEVKNGFPPVDSLNVCQLGNTHLNNEYTLTATQEISEIEKDLTGIIHLYNKDPDTEIQAEAEHRNDSPGGIQSEIDKQLLDAITSNTAYENPSPLGKKNVLTPEHVERSSFGFLESCFGLNSSVPNTGVLQQDVKDSNLVSHTEPPVLQKIIFGPDLNNDNKTNAPHDPPVVSAVQQSSACQGFTLQKNSDKSASASNNSLTHLEIPKRKLQPVVLLNSGVQNTDDVNKYNCLACGLSTPGVDELIEHHHQIHSLHNYRFCPSCDRCFTGDFINAHPCGQSQDLPSYAKQLTEKVGRFVCRYCKKTFMRKKFYEQHIRKHIFITDHRCKMCGLYLPNSKRLQSHKTKKCFPLVIHPPIQHAHLNIPTLSETAVAEENEKTDTSGDLSCYIKLMDVYQTSDSPEKIQCKVCGKTFSFRAQLYGHLKAHTFQKPFKCTKCDKSFKYAWRLSKHQKEPCSQKKATQVKSLSAHQLSKYKCPICPRHFTRSLYRTRHLRHYCLKEFIKQGKGKVGGKFQCPLCKAAFTLACNRNRHIKLTCTKFQFYTDKGLSKKSDLTVVLKNKHEKVSTLILPSQKALPYKCSSCPKKFGSKSSLYRHTILHRLHSNSQKTSKHKHISGATFTVSIAGSQKPASKAMAEKSLNNPFCCDFCEKTFALKRSFRKHLARHAESKLFRCSECGETFSKQRLLRAHKNLHKGKVQCSVCLEVLPTIGEFIVHRQAHPTKAMMKCPECPVQFKFAVLLLRHMDVHERKAKPVHKHPPKKLKTPNDKEEFKCLLCKKDFKDSKTLSAHCLIHQSPLNVSTCQLCKKSYSSHAALNRHFRIHTGEKPFGCSACGKHFNRKEYLKLHNLKCLLSGVPSQKAESPQVKTKSSQVKANSPQVKAEPKVVKITQASKLYYCSYCPHVFKLPCSLFLHEKAHLGNTLFICTKCNKYYRKRKIKQHVEDCTGAKSKPECRKCGRCFSRVNNKDIHEKNCKGKKVSPRSKENTFECIHCGQKCSDQDGYLQHEAYCNGGSKQTGAECLKEPEKTKQIFAEVSAMKDGHLDLGENGDQLKCKFCTKTFLRARNLRVHILTHNEVKPYRCKTCNSCFSRYDHLNLHQVRCRGRRQLEVRVVKINLEDLKANSSKVLTQDDELQCKICLKKFSALGNLRRHTSMLHIVEKPFSCKICCKRFITKKSLQAHNYRIPCKKTLKETVETTKMVQNEPCRETSKLLQRIQVHYMNKMKFQCEYCPRRFKQFGQMKIHERLHTGDKPYGCANCGEHFIRRDYLKRHLVKCNGGGQEKFLCNKCGDLFTGEALVVHQKTCIVKSELTESPKGNDKTRSTLRGFSCTTCNARFLLFSQLQQHFLASHRSDQPPTLDGNQQQLKSSNHVYNIEVKQESCQTDASDELHSLDTNLIKCTKCSSRFSSSRALGQHMRIHRGSYPFSCKKCQVGFWSKKAVEKHRRRCKVAKDNESALVHSTSVETPMNERVIVFNKGSNATGTGVLQTTFSCKNEKGKNNVRKADSSHKYQCSECDQVFTDGLTLISHLEEHGKEEQKGDRKCHVCNKVYDQARKLQRHLMTVHNEKIVHTCDICSKSLRSASELEEHRAHHDPSRQYVCDICELRYTTERALSLHLRLTHKRGKPQTSERSRVQPKEVKTVTDEQVYRCEPCDKTYYIKRSYQKHFQTKHALKSMERTVGTSTRSSSNPSLETEKGVSEKESENEESDTNLENDSDNDSDSAPYFPCHVCGKTFLTSESLEDHQRCHLGEKPFECEECGKCFVQLSHLQHHQRCHRSEFQCQLCGKGFVSLFSLRKHKQKHMKKGAFACTKCHLSFTRQSYLAEHVLFHKDENFPCDLCDKTFSCKTTRAEHRKVHTEQDGLPPLIPPKPPKIKQEPLSNYSNNPSSSSTEQYKYRCGMCQVRFPDPRELSEHGCNPAKDRPYSCPDCNKHFLHGSHLKKHQLSHQFAVGRYQCNDCSMSFTHNHLFLAHQRSHKCKKSSINSKFPKSEETVKLAKIYQCPICPLSFYQALDLANHLSVHSHMCSVCNMTFPGQDDLEEHEQCHLTAETQYECTECGDHFVGSDSFRKHRCRNLNVMHVDKRHSEELASSSNKRSSKSLSQVGEEEEDVDVGEDFFVCPICKKRFSSKSSLVEHHKANHEAPRPFKCLVCSKTFAQKRYLTQHQQTHSIRPYKCDVCTESFKTETSLAYHSKLHDPKRQFHCPICSRSYLSEKDLSKHKQKHVQHQNQSGNDREYRCDMCYKSFTMFADLQKHQESHVGQVVYECTECDKAFAFPHLLEEHQQTHAATSMESVQF